ncbi:MAG: porin family protein [Pseudomonadota bacterium]
MRTLAMAITLASATTLPTAMAQSDLYLNGGVSVFDSDDATINALTLRGGVELHPLLGAEFETSYGLGAEEIDESDGAEVELETQFAGFVVGRYPLTRRLDVLGRVGYSVGELQTSTAGLSSDAETDGFAFGLGSEYMITDNFGIRGDYTRIEVDDDQIDGGINVIAIAGVLKFGDVR